MHIVLLSVWEARGTIWGEQSQLLVIYLPLYALLSLAKYMCKRISRRGLTIVTLFGSSLSSWIHESASQQCRLNLNSIWMRKRTHYLAIAIARLCARVCDMWKKKCLSNRWLAFHVHVNHEFQCKFCHITVTDCYPVFVRNKQPKLRVCRPFSPGTWQQQNSKNVSSISPTSWQNA